MLPGYFSTPSSLFLSVLVFRVSLLMLDSGSGISHPVDTQRRRTRRAKKKKKRKTEKIPPVPGNLRDPGEDRERTERTGGTGG